MAFTGDKKPIVIFFLASCLLMGCQPSKPKMEKYRQAQTMMGTTVSIDVCVDKDNKERLDAAYDEVWKELEDVAWRMNVFDPKSDVTKINEAKGEPVKIEADTYQVLKRAVDFSNLTRGAFDITVYPLIQLWKRSEQKNQRPGMEELKKIKEFVGSGSIQFLGNDTLRLNHPEAKIDLGGIAAGFAIDQAVQIFHRQGIANFYIDIGGDIYAGGYNCEGRPWRVGIVDPRDRSKIMEVVELTDAAVATSGHYEKYYTIQNEHWSHIINPMTGFPQKEVISATIITPTAIEADALSTALCVLGPKEGIALTNSLKKGYASVIIVQEANQNIKRYVSEGYQKYLIQP